jgi:uncharacterized protein (TIGR00297 family)
MLLALPLPVAALISLAFAWVAWRMRAVSRNGAMAGFAVSCILLRLAGAAFLILLGVFVLTWAATRFGRARKQVAGIAERSAGRGARQVLANLGVGALACAALGGLEFAAPALGAAWRLPLLAAFLAAMAECTADTVSSEVGQAASPRAWLLTGWRWVPAGTDGAITVTGTLAGAAGAAAIAVAAAGLGLLPASAALCAGMAGFLGMLFDTLLGGTLERRGVLGNNAVNCLSTLFAAALGLWWCG